MAVRMQKNTGAWNRQFLMRQKSREHQVVEHQTARFSFRHTVNQPKRDFGGGRDAAREKDVQSFKWFHDVRMIQHGQVIGGGLNTFKITPFSLAVGAMNFG